MNDLPALLTALKRELKARGITYRHVATHLELSEPSVKRLLGNGHLSLDRFLAICELAGLSLGELTQISARRTQLSRLTEAQEAELVADQKRLLVAVCVLNHWTAEDILRCYTLTEAECIASLTRLEKIGLIELYPGNRVRLKIARDFDWLPNGPIRRYFREQGEPDFLAADFHNPQDHLTFRHAMLTEAAIKRLHAELERLGRELAILHQDSLSAPWEARHGVGLLAAFREWEPKGFVGLRR